MGDGRRQFVPDERFGFADRNAAGDDVTGHAALCVLVRQREQRAGVAHRECAGAQVVAHSAGSGAGA